MTNDQHEDLGTYVPPAARPLSDFSMTEVSEDEIILFDNERMTYHTLNNAAFDIWQQCDGIRTTQQISDASHFGSNQVSAEIVTLAVRELIEAGLMHVSNGVSWSFIMDRRHLLRLSIGSAAAAISLPVVTSITAPTALAADSQLTCGSPCGVGDICNHPAGCSGGIEMCCCALSHNPSLRFCGEDRGGGLCVVPSAGGATGSCA